MTTIETEASRARREAREYAEAVSRARGRPRVMAGERPSVEITEEVVTILDALRYSMDAGSGFLDDEQERAIDMLCRLLRFRCETYVMGLADPYGRRLVPGSFGYCRQPYGHEGAHTPDARTRSD